MDFLFIILSTALANNFVLVNYLGLCPFMGVSQNTSHLFGMSLAVCVVLIVSTLITTPLRWLLPAAGLIYLYPLLAIVAIAVTVQLIGILLRFHSPLVHASLGIYLPLVTTNCAILGVLLLNRRQNDDLGEALALALGAGLGLALVLYIFSYLRHEIDQRQIPKFLQGTPIALITAGILAMSMSAFSPG